MESPAFCRSTITTTALVHSSSPPGFIANEKDLSPKGKLKTHNGCVVREKEKIILLKRVYGSPVRRSSRVRRKGCAVLPRSKVKYRHSDPIVAPQLNGRATKSVTRGYPRSVDSTPIRSESQRTAGELDHSSLSDSMTTPNGLQAVDGFTSPEGLTSLHHFMSPNKLSESDFFRSDGTPRRKLMVRISETPEMRKKLAEGGMTFRGMSTEVCSPSAYEGSSHDNVNPITNPPRVGMESKVETPEHHPKLKEQNSDLFGAFLNFSSESDSEDDFAENPLDKCALDPHPMSFLGRQSASTGTTNHGHFLDSNVKPDDKVSPLAEALTKTANTDIEDQTDTDGNDSSLCFESVDTSDELINMRDPADEVLCISPLPFNTSEANISASNGPSTEYPLLEGEECSQSHHDGPTFLPIKQNQEPKDGDIIDPPTPPCTLNVHTHDNSCIGTGLSVAAICTCSCVSFTSRVPLVTSDLGKNNQFGLMVSPTAGIQQKCDAAECLHVPPVNGMRSRQMLMSLSVSVSPESMNGTSSEQLGNKDQHQDKVSITYVTPNHNVDGSLKGKEPSPSYASQANSESPFTPRSATCQNEECEEITPHSSSLSHSPMQSDCSSRSLKSNASTSSKTISIQDDNFQDFSEFEFISSDSCSSHPPFVQAASSPLVQAASSPFVQAGSSPPLQAVSSPPLQAVSSPPLQAVSPPVVAQYPSECCLVSNASMSSHSKTKQQYDIAPSNCDFSPSQITDAAHHSSLACNEEQNGINWSDMFESDAAYYNKLSPNGIDDCNSDKVWFSAPDFSMNETRKSARRKKQEKPTSQRSSLRIARRMSLLSLETETPSSEETESNSTTETLHFQLQSHEPSQFDSNMASRQTTGSDQERNTETKNWSQSTHHSSSVHCASSDSTSVVDSSTLLPALADAILLVDGVSENSNLAGSQSNDNGSNVSADKLISKPKTYKTTSKQSRRRSVRLNCVVLPLTVSPVTAVTDSEGCNVKSIKVSTDKPLSNSSCSESISSQGDIKCQFEGDTEDIVRTWLKDHKGKQKRSRRYSARLNPIGFSLTNESLTTPMESENNNVHQLLPNFSSGACLSTEMCPLTDASDSECLVGSVQIAPLSNSSCSESISSQGDINCQFEGDTEDIVRTWPKDREEKQKRSRRRSARLNPVGFSLANESLTTPTESENNNVHQLLPNSNFSSVACLSKEMGPVTNSECLVGPVQIAPERDMSIELPLATEFSVPSMKEKKRQDKDRCKRRRSTRLLKLSMINLEDKETSDEISHSDVTTENDPMENKTLNNASHLSNTLEEFGKKEENSPTSVITENGLDVQNEIKCDVEIVQELVDNTESSSLMDVNVPVDAFENCSEGSSLLDDTCLAVHPRQAGRVGRPRRKSTVVSYLEDEEVKSNKSSRRKEEAVKELYLKRGEKKALKPNNLETIFEDVHFRKKGSPCYIGMKKFKRAVVFSEHPWLPRKKRKMPKNKNGQLKNKRKAPQDPNIERNLEALLAEWTPMSPTCNSPSASNASTLENHVALPYFDAEIGQTETVDKESYMYWSSRSISEKPSRESQISCVSISKHSDINSDSAETPVNKEIREICFSVSETVEQMEETVPKRPKRDTPFKGSKGMGSYGAWLKQQLQDKE